MRSTLPDLFRSDLNTIKFHPNQRPPKIGGRFAINLNKNATAHGSPQKSPHKLKKLEQSSGFARTIYDGTSSHIRSQSINSLIPAIKHEPSYGNSSLHKAKKSVNFSNQPTYMSTRNHSTSILSKQTPTLQEIYHQNITTNNTSSFQKHPYNFPYETTRSMNNMKIQLQQADSFKNRVENLISKQQQNQKTFSSIVKQTNYIKESMIHFRQAYLQDLQMFEQQFQFMCKDLMKSLSLHRRQTAEQTKVNAGDIQRTYYEYRDSGSILELLQKRTNLLRNQCIDDEKIQLTNSKTYTQDIQLRLYQNHKSMRLDELFRRTKRSGTSQEVRAGTSRVSSRNGIQLITRAQTTEVQGRKFMNNNNHHQIQGSTGDEKDDEDLGMYQEVGINENITNQPLLNFRQQVFDDY